MNHGREPNSYLCKFVETFIILLFCDSAIMVLLISADIVCVCVCVSRLDMTSRNIATGRVVFLVPNNFSLTLEHENFESSFVWWSPPK
jgi:hypothetical protein